MSADADKSNLAKRSVAALGWSYAGAFGRLFAQLVIQVLLARLLGPQAFGQATAALIILNLGWLMSDAGFGAALVQRPELSEQDIGYALGWILLTSLLLGIAIALASGVIASLLGDSQLAPLVIACAALVPLQALSSVPTSLMRRQLDMKRLQLIQLGGYVVSYGAVGLTLAWLGFGAWCLVIAFAVQSFITLTAAYGFVRHTLRPRLSGDDALRAFGLRVMGTNIANWAIENLDRMIVSRNWGLASLGEYSAASNLSRAPVALLIASVQSVAFASASKVQADPVRLARGFLAVLGLISMLSFPIFMFLALHADLVVHTLYGERWSQVGPLFAAFCVGLPFHAILCVTGPVLWAVGAVSSELKAQLITATCVLVGFGLLGGFELAAVVWLIPALYLLRVLLVYLALARRVALAHTRSLRALCGGFAFAAITVLAWLAGRQVLSEGLVGAGVGAVLTTLLCLTAVRLFPHALISPELSVALSNRAAESGLALKLCQFLGLK